MLSTILSVKCRSSKFKDVFYMSKKFILILLLTSCQTVLYANNSFDTVIYETMVNVAGKDVNKAIHIADSLYKASTEPIHKVKSLMLLADLNLTIGKKNEAVNYAFMAEQITSDNGLYEWQARIYGFLSSHYRSLGLKEQSKIYLDKGLTVINKVEDAGIINQYKGVAFQEQGLYEIENKEYKKSLEYFKKAEPYFKKVRNEGVRNYQLALNHMQLGRAYMYLKERKYALIHFKNALNFLSQLKNEASVLKGFIYEGMGRAFFEDNELKNALVYLKDALKIAEHSDNLNLKEEVYYDMAVYYMETGDKVNYKHYHKLYQETMENSIKTNKNSSEVLVNRLQEREKELAQRQNLLLAVSGFLLVILIVLIIRSRSKRKKQYKKFQAILKNVSEQSKIFEIVKEEEVFTKEELKPVIEIAGKELMSSEVEQQILKKLARFEQGDKFTGRNITLSALSVLLDTNSKYLSHVINKHKKKDFNSYINELRIFYIIKKLESSPTYLNYKISYLAEECGFSSHSKFTAVFKTVTGMSPSSFMQFLAKNQKKLTA
ncbi:helix-turn-helix domain-containing protein [Flavobacterium cerinum]|uniref:Helix-turn-helix domain-containing protein n=2 Tax=Flavobacterium cerinum TaxID=2502784 RepID=A0A444GKZ9_9FLAO|nr:helix-turn-helix domain-containing protein [Flavobacterium cerinum]